jgi:hypothetical protein
VQTLEHPHQQTLPGSSVSGKERAVQKVKRSSLRTSTTTATSIERIKFSQPSLPAVAAAAAVSAPASAPESAASAGGGAAATANSSATLVDGLEDNGALAGSAPSGQDLSHHLLSGGMASYIQLYVKKAQAAEGMARVQSVKIVAPMSVAPLKVHKESEGPVQGDRTTTSCPLDVVACTSS